MCSNVHPIHAAPTIKAEFRDTFVIYIGNYLYFRAADSLARAILTSQ